ncbi:uncharacterized protein Z518_07613 [Rhinocladiella mackenziei CBS 650.93]|uniref:DUF7514 domain-containing protein n=1 Tax=Rhinocladiella mackenziei CBS 650.93 TaxID=1442369 RepID=A0A0D2J4Z4_9EURO|nr:uncharacterized protein Z518_07613 [Rhinocladiella mackenziei CBS 650.93]KIX04060.1 hypothetical protein Z518_07613 [Rhinocladiella mackenziei CBS 650.93]
MASNDGRVPPQPNGTSLDDNADSRRLHPTLSNSISNDGGTQRSRGPSITRQGSTKFDPSRCNQTQQPINDAITSAFNNTDAASATSFSPELLQQITSQITANVLQQLKASNFAPPPLQPQTSGSQMDAASSTAGSPPLDRATVYTPPSPYRASEDAGMGPQSPQFPSPPSQPPFLPSSLSGEKRAVSPLSQGGRLSEGDIPQERPSRPKGPKRMPTGGDTTTLERVWGVLFNEQGQATPRLGQFLRGIAVHLIEDYEPKHSLVITPTKLQRYYEETKLANELYPWKIVFDDRTSSISRMFREIEAQHHLVQDKLNERPDVPGLTPQGFETWVTLLLKAHPDQEYERLAKTALDMPISNPDEKKERFPKELSRRLFPNRPDTEIAYKLQRAMSTHCNVNFGPLQGSTASTTGSNIRASQSSQPAEDQAQKPNLRPPTEKLDSVNSATQPSPTLSHVSIEQQRQPYSSVPADGADGVGEEETEDTPTRQPIERERKPYVAAPGGGKNYDNIDKPAAVTESKPPLPPPEVKLGRSSSVHATSRTNDMSRTGPNPISIHQRPPPPRPMEIPETRHHRSNSTYHRDQPRPGHNRSPSMTTENGGPSYMRRSENDAPYTPSTHHSFNGNDQYEDARRFKEYEAHRERLANDRYDAARMSAYDPRERERDRENRPRMQSVSGFDGPHGARGPPAYSTSVPATEEDYYRDRMHTSGTASYSMPASISTGFQPPPSGMMREPSSSVGRDSAYGSYTPTSAYPPSSYRDVR